MQDQFKALQDDHKQRLGVSWSISPQVGENSIVGLHNFGKIKGNGAIAVREICALADRLGITLTLACSTPKLTPWYEALGFRVFAEFGEVKYSVRYFRRRCLVSA